MHILVASVPHLESPRDHADLPETAPRVQMPRVDVGVDDAVKDHVAVMLVSGGLYAVKDEFLTQMPAPVRRIHEVSGVGSAAASPRYVRMKDVKPEDVSVG